MDETPIQLPVDVIRQIVEKLLSETRHNSIVAVSELRDALLDIHIELAKLTEGSSV